MFGEPIYHDNFGEGFDGEWNEDLEDYDEPEIKSSFASYFVTLNNINFHIGYDHRGTTFEVEINSENGLNFDNSKDPDSEIEKLENACKEFINLFKNFYDPN